MEIVKIKEDEKSLLLEVKGESYTLTSSLEEALWKNNNVSEAATFREHPYLSEPKIWVMVKKGKPKDALKEAAEELIKEVKEFKEKFKKSL
ncbi:MAG: RpoL/Rpb11 RNA polymerase subunit family protein [Candidatus Aenigmatarchaeota archaeon]|jgi:DNA-directed RNA polymerase subunit L